MSGPHIFTVRLSRRYQDRPLYEAWVQAGFVSKVVIHAAHMFGHGWTIKPYSSWSEAVYRASQVEEFLSGVVHGIPFDCGKAVARIRINILWKCSTGYLQ